MEVVWTVDAADSAAAAGGEIVFRTEAACDLASVVSSGPASRRPASYELLLRWIDGHGRRAAGSPREYSLVGEWNEPDPEAWLTEIRIPVTAR